jgi:hypothetical protein
MTQLLDLSRRDVEGPVQQVLACLAAAWVMGAKFCGKAGPMGVSDSLAQRLAACATTLSEREGGSVVSTSDVAREELSLAQGLKCNVSSPTVHMWLRSFGVRFAVVMKGGLSEVLSVASSLQEQLTHQLVWNTRVCAEQPPYSTAVGIFALTLAAVHAPVAAQLCPPQMDAARWGATLDAVLIASLLEIGMPGAAHKQLQGVPSHLDKIVAAGLEFATLCDGCSIRSASWHMLEVLRVALAPDLPGIACA